MIDRKTIDEVIERANAHIVDIIGDYVDMRRRGANYVGCCPFHNEKTGSFTVSPAKGIYKCFGCGEHGNAVGFMMRQENWSFPKAITMLGKRFGIEVVEHDLTDEEKQLQAYRDALQLVLKFAADTYSGAMWAEGSDGLNYMRLLRFRDDIVKKFQIGYAPAQPGFLINEAYRQGYKDEYLQKLGLVSADEETGEMGDTLQQYIVVPVKNEGGKLLGFNAINTLSDSRTPYISLISPEFLRSPNYIYGIGEAKAPIIKLGMAYIVFNSVWDVWVMNQCGFENSISIQGRLNYVTADVLKRCTNSVTLIVGNDIDMALQQIYDTDLLIERSMTVRVVQLPDDPTVYQQVMRSGSEPFCGFVKKNATNVVRFKAELLMAKALTDDDVEAAKQQVIGSILKCTDYIMQSLLIEDVAPVLGESADELYKFLPQELQ